MKAAVSTPRAATTPSRSGGVPSRLPGAARVPACPLLLAGGLFFLLSELPAQAYIGPGAGFAVFGSFLFMLAAFFLGLGVLLTWPLRFLLRARRRRRAYAAAQTDRVVVIGLDGLDPELTDALLAEGKLPNLARLRDAGTYARLATSTPAMSPVAWSSFMTGAGPGRHGIFDFLHRDPRTYLPDLSSAQIRPSPRVLRLGPWAFPLGKPILRNLRRSKPFWTILGEHGIFSTVLRVPITFPPEPFRGLLLSGMCVPDLRGTQGSFTFFSTAERAPAEHTGGEAHRLLRTQKAVTGTLPGPARTGSEQAAQAPFRLTPLDDQRARLDLGPERLTLRLGECSDWTPVEFALGPGQRAPGLCRWYLKQLTPEVELYASPINIDPERPALPISHPAIYAIYLAKRLGKYATLGLAEDTWALNEGVLDDAAFLTQCRLFFEERERMLMNALENNRHGCVVCVFDTTDRIQHMFWRGREPDHPAATAHDSEACRRAIEEVYLQSDALVGRVAAKLKPEEVLVVLSDHGFKSFRRGVNVNAWLRDHGYLHLQPNATGDKEWLREVDWSRTKAYALGLSGLYLNLLGREGQGIVSPEAAPALKQELIAALSGLRDEQEHAEAITRVYDTAATTPGPYVEVGPDLTVGYAPGYRASWGAAQGKIAGPVIEDNTRRWSGDHCLDPAQVPGVLFCNRPLAADARMLDVAPTLLALFGIKTPGYMEGHSLLPAHEEVTARV